MLATVDPNITDCRNPDRINAVVNDPSVRPFVGMADAGDLDLSAAVADPNNLFPFGAHGGFALIWTAPRTYEVHTFILPEGRGIWARLAAASGIQMAVDRGARVLWTRVPADRSRHIRRFATGMGMTPTGEVCAIDGHLYEILAMEVNQCPQR